MTCEKCLSLSAHHFIEVVFDIDEFAHVVSYHNTYILCRFACIEKVWIQRISAEGYSMYSWITKEGWIKRGGLEKNPR